MPRSTQDRYLRRCCAERIGADAHLRAWRKVPLRFQYSGAVRESRQVVFFDLDAWARHLERIQLEATEAARAWENRFRLVVMFPAAAIAAAIAMALLQGGRF
jgi:hypothetical protein